MLGGGDGDCGGEGRNRGNARGGGFAGSLRGRSMWWSRWRRREGNSASINTSPSTGPVDSLSFSSRLPLRFQPNWSGAPGHPTMADTVRMSGCQGKDSNTPIVATAPADSINTSRSTGPVDNFTFFSQLPVRFQQNWSRAPGRPTMTDISNSMLHQNRVLPLELNWESHSSHDHVSNVTEINRDPGGSGIQQTSHEELSLADQPLVRSDQVVSGIFDASASYADEPAPSSLHACGVDQASDGIIRCQNLLTEAIKSASVSGRQVVNSGYGFPHVYGHHEGAPAHPTMADIVRMVGCQGKASSTPIVKTAPTDSINTSQATGPVDNFSFSSPPPFSFEHNWSGAPASPTMADIVRMGGLNESHSNSMLYQNIVLPVELNWESHSSHNHVSNVTEINRDPGGAGFRQHDELSLADQPSVRSGQIVSEIFDASASYVDEPAPSSLHAYGADLALLNDDQVIDRIIRSQNLPTKSIKSASASDRQVDNSGYAFPHVQGHHEGIFL
ncbi:hypothetical protein COCNU_02G004710 [Cocos nucifera]|uniref:Uncharacterized protein n=1 Tax=Cocos nucifera TaxID=13894 RepID=A0A8K0HYB5_COCNU|nr:hypothetical protein COCNU_02G004710 [Cocos nucifera]